MIELPKNYEELFSLAVQWVRDQEQHILKNGIELTTDLKIDAYQVGVKEIEKVRLLKVDKIPLPSNPKLNDVLDDIRLLNNSTIGTSYRYGILIKKEHWLKRKLVVHELVHTMQYERLGSIENFLKSYIAECIVPGYPMGALEQEAWRIEEEICR